jgi:DNA (cytosine-5)-methyltransferase 1
MSSSGSAIPVVDFFAGPGGLGEGFTNFRTPKGTPGFRIVLSVEKDPVARSTLRLRSFFRQFGLASDVPDCYYDYVQGAAAQPFDFASEPEWTKAGSEALCATLGESADDAAVDSALAKHGLKGKEWVLIGGPPCQAYSLVGRARNAGIKGYRAETDQRHFLYQHYLRVVHDLRPAAFVLENVKGILSSRVGGTEIFSRMLADLSQPSRALARTSGSAVRYRILAASTSALFEPGMDPEEVDPRRFIIKAEEHGLAQARHRVILIGLREDVGATDREAIPFCSPLTTRDLIADLPRLRSAISDSRRADFDSWVVSIRRAAAVLAAPCKRMGFDGVAEFMRYYATLPVSSFPVSRGADDARPGRRRANSLLSRLRDARLSRVLNHQARSHMEADLARYLFCSAFAQEYHDSPRAADFPPALAPRHQSWGSGAFDDRFRVQLADKPATTITSHISKDGHYFIHYDPLQCRSLTVREAARLQGFPDNYFFEGNRTQQYIQVGNAVPPPLAELIAQKVYDSLGR